MEKTSTHNDARFIAATPELREKITQVLEKFTEVYGDSAKEFVAYYSEALAKEEWLPAFSAFTEILDSITVAINELGIEPATVFGKVMATLKDMDSPRVSRLAIATLVTSSGLEIANMRFKRVKEGGVGEFLEQLAKMTKSGEATVEVVRHDEEETTAPASTETH